MAITIVSYQRFADMPRALHSACCIMGDHSGHMRRLAENLYLRNGEPHFTLREALVMYDGGEVIGWAALYDAWGLDHPCASVWIWPHMRGQGYGSRLMKDMHERWHKAKPEVFNSVVKAWRELEEGRATPTQISPNASVTMVPLYTGYAS